MTAVMTALVVGGGLLALYILRHRKCTFSGPGWVVELGGAIDPPRRSRRKPATRRPRASKGSKRKAES
jgi:hypothetical protein